MLYKGIIFVSMHIIMCIIANLVIHGEPDNKWKYKVGLKEIKEARSTYNSCITNPAGEIMLLGEEVSLAECEVGDNEVECVKRKLFNLIIIYNRGDWYMESESEMNELNDCQQKIYDNSLEEKCLLKIRCVYIGLKKAGVIQRIMLNHNPYNNPQIDLFECLS